jgi:hypothetical protein
MDMERKMSRSTLILFLVVSMMISLFNVMPSAKAASSEDSLTIVNHGSEEAVIVSWSKDNARSVVDFAAEELQQYIFQMTGAQLPIVTGVIDDSSQIQNISDSIIILTGSQADSVSSSNSSYNFPASWLSQSELLLTDTKEDSFVINTANELLVLAGMNDRGTLFAAYDLLEKFGVRYFAPEFEYYDEFAEYVPANSSLIIDAINVVEEPDFQFRRKYVEEGWSHTSENLIEMIDWMAKQKQNVLVVPYDYIAQGNTRWDDFREDLIEDLEKRDMMIEVGGHGFESFLRPEELQAEHPDWFVSGYNVFNIANEDAVNHYVEEVIEFLRERPEITIFDAWPPDVASWPQVVLNRFGSSANAYAYVVNKLHEAVKAELPNVKLEAIAYTTHVDAPSAAYMYDEDVLIDFAPYFRSYRDPIDAPANSGALNQVTQWKNVYDGNLTMYEYYRRYAFGSKPIVFPQLIAYELPFYRDFGLDGIGTFSEPADWITFEITHYVLAKMSWDVDVNGGQLISQYIDARYGTALQPMSEYFDLVESAGRSVFNTPTGDMGNQTRVTEMRNKYITAKNKLEAAYQLTQSGSSEQYMIQRLLWNIEYAIADIEVNYYSNLGDNASASLAKLSAMNSMNAHRHDGIILQNSYSMRKFINNYGNTDWVYEMYKDTFAMDPMISTMGTYQNNGIKNMVDGNPNTFYWSSINPMIGDYVGVDLKEVKLIDQIQVLMSKADKPNDYIRNAVVEVSSDFNTWIAVAQLSNQPEATIQLEEEVEARYVRIRSTAAQTQWVIVRDIHVSAQDIVLPPEEEFTAWLTIGQDEIESEDPVHVAVSARSSTDPIYAIDLNLQYDASILTLDDIVSLNDDQSIHSQEEEDGLVRIIIARLGENSGLTGEDQIIMLNFTANEVEETIQVPIQITRITAGLSDSTEIEGSPYSAIVTVNPKARFINEDVNQDGRVTIGDLAIVAVHYGKAKNNLSPSEWDAVKRYDVNGDEKIDISDFAQIASKILG